MKRIMFVTEDEESFRIAKRYLNAHTISLVQAPEHTLLPSQDHMQDSIANKAMASYQKLQEPCFVIESSFMIEALKQFPGTKMDYVLNTIGTDGLLKLMEGQTNRNCVFRQVLGYYDGHEMLYFYNDKKGILATKKAGDSNSNALSQIFIPESYQLSLEQSHTILQPDCIEQFARYLNTHLATLIDDPYHES